MLGTDIAMVSIRPIHEEDIDSVVDLIYRSITITNAPDYHPDVIKAQSRIFTADWVRSRMKVRYMIVAFDHNEIVGVGSFAKGEMMSIYVDPDHIQRGIGTLIMSHLEEYARTQGYDQVHLGSSKTAVDFYKKLGFHLDEEVTFESGGQKVIGYQMSKSLD